MKYDPQDMEYQKAHGLIIPIVSPRPIALVSTVGSNGVFNVAPFSLYGLMHHKPAIVYVSISDRRRKRQRKDTINNILFSREFVISAVTEDMAEAMNACGQDSPPDVSEFTVSGLTPIPSDLVKARCVGESPVNMECRLLHNLIFGQFPESVNVVIGEVLRIHVKDEFIKDGVFLSGDLNLIGRAGVSSYCRTNDTFDLPGTLHDKSRYSA
jgi:flavin reductase (DIM6/NTAB) family NADH-FMN oxidoreductase RutF